MRNLRVVWLFSTLVLTTGFVDENLGPFPRIVKQPDGQNCNNVYDRCARIYGAPGQDFFLIDKAVYTRFATDNYKYSEVSNSRAAKRLFRVDGYRYSIGPSGNLIVELGMPGNRYFVMPICKNSEEREVTPARNKKPLYSPDFGEFLEMVNCET